MSNSNSKNKMLIDSTHPEETRVVVLRNGRIEEFDWESAARKLLRGNIYLAKVTRVEPSLQAAFVDYGGNRHGFLAFSEIHPDYYQIPMADRQALLEEEAEAEEAKAKAEEAEDAALSDVDDGDEPSGDSGNGRRDEQRYDAGHARSDAERPSGAGEPTNAAEPDASYSEPRAVSHEPMHEGAASPDEHQAHDTTPSSMPLAVSSERIYDDRPVDGHAGAAAAEPHDHNHNHDHDHGTHATPVEGSESNGERHRHHGHRSHSDDNPEFGSRVVEVVEPEGNGATDVETVGAEDVVEEIPDRPRRYARQYKIQEVIRRRQIILVQVVKEERGNKGAALTTYLSLAGRYTVLMPNTARGGGISRKIANSTDRKRLRKIVTELEVPKGMGLIVRTAGASRTKAEIKRDFEYLLRLWESVRDLTLRSTAPALVYEEGDLIKRSIRDLYSKEIEDITVAGEQAYASARDFMQMLMPSHVGNVIPYRAPEPLFTKYQIERQLNAMFSPFVTLRSGGYIVINQTEALVSIDINSGKSTREHNIEDTALKTNLEASEEIARQLKLRDLAGLIVIDYIDMEEKRNNRAVERRMKESLRHDRARIQVGRISHFGLLEMSRQRLRPGVLEGSTTQCPHCQGTGTIRSTESVALAVLRGIEDKMMSGERFNVVAQTTADVALYILNQKRHFLNDMESRYGVTITILASDKVHGANFVIERGPAIEERSPVRRTDVVQMDASHHGAAGSWDVGPGDEDSFAEEGVEGVEDIGGDEAGADDVREGSEASGDGERRGRRRRRRRRGGRNGTDQPMQGDAAPDSYGEGALAASGDSDDFVEAGQGRQRDAGSHDFADREPGVHEVDTDTEVETIGADGDDAHGDDDPTRAEGDRAEGDRGSDGRRRRRGRRGGRRGGRDRDGREGEAPIQGGASDQAMGHDAEPLPIARPDEWMRHEPTVGDLAAEQQRRSGGHDQPSYYSPVDQDAGRGAPPRGEATTWRRHDAEPHRHEHVAHEVPGQAAYDEAGAKADHTSSSTLNAVGDTSPHAEVEQASTQFDGLHPPPAPVHGWENGPAQDAGRQTHDTAHATEVSAHRVEPPAVIEVPVAAAPPEPKVEEPPPPPEPPRPRRSGWWSRRVDG